MYKVKVNETHIFEIEGEKINGIENPMDIIEVRDGAFHIISKARSYTATVLDAKPEEKSFLIRINQNEYHIHVQDKYDILLQQLGMSNLNNKKINQIKAPMPGLVLRTEKKVGDAVKKGDTLLILEAMKMENMIKSPGDAVVKRIAVEIGQAVEKNQILIEFE